MKNKLPIIAIATIFAVGVGLLFYPMASAVVNNLQSRNNAVAYLDNAALLTSPETEKMLKAAQDYNKNLLNTATLTDPFSEKTTEKSGESYEEILDTDGYGLMGYIDIPKINLYLPIYHGTSLEVLKKGVGHLENTAMPIGGKSTHCVLSAHSAYPTRSFFDYLPKLEKGDSFYIHILNDTLKYEVDRIKIVSPTDTSDLSITENKSYITLITCAPYSINTHRLLVRGVRVENDKSAADLTPRVLKIEKNSFYLMGCEIGYINAAVILCAIIAAVTLTVLFILRKASNKLIKVHKFVSSAKSEKGKKL